MSPHSQYTIRPALDQDARELVWLAGLDSRSPLRGPTLVAEMDGAIVAAISLEDGRAIADPFRRTLELVVALRTTRTTHLRRGSTPSLRERIFASLNVPRREPGVSTR